MTEKIVTEYRGFVIEFQEFSESWKCEIAEGKMYEKLKLAEVKKRIDMFWKNESAFKDIDAITLDSGWGSDKYFGTVVTITSVCENGDIWIKRDGNRTKMDVRNKDLFCKVTDENKHLLSVIAKLEADRLDLANLISKTKSELERIFPD